MLQRTRSEKQSLSCVQLFVIPWTMACQAPLSMGFSRQKYWSGQPFSSPGNLPSPEIKLRSPALQADFLPPEPQGSPHQELYTVFKTNHQAYFSFQLIQDHFTSKTFLPISVLYRCCSVTKSCRTLCNPMDCNTPGSPVLHCLPEFALTQVH